VIALWAGQEKNLEVSEMKKLTFIILLLALMAPVAASALIIPLPPLRYSVSYDWWGLLDPVTPPPPPNEQTTYEVITNNTSYYLSLLNLDPPALTIDTFEPLTVRHKMNSHNSSEQWQLWCGPTVAEQNILLGVLTTNSNTNWKQDAFNLPLAAQQIMQSTFTLYLSLHETHNDGQTIWLDKSDLTGWYTPYQEQNPIPEPMTLMLVGSGLLGLGALRRKK
jgi:hypothetical protein